MENVVKKPLESNEPSIRLRTLTEVLGESIRSRTAREIQEEVKRSETSPPLVIRAEERHPALASLCQVVWRTLGSFGFS